MEMETVHAIPPAAAGPPSLVAGLGRNRLILSGLALAPVAVGLAWQWNWLVAIGAAPLLVSAAPYVAMCALGLCVHRMGSRTCTNAPDTSTIHAIP